jgi:hypothetical protein
MKYLKYLLSILLILIPSAALATVYNASSCEYEDVKTAVALATNAGDTVNVSPGACDWGASYLTISKAIKLVGAGTSQTTGTRITGTGNTTYGFGMFKIDTGSTESTFPFEMTGFRVTSTTTVTAKNMVRIQGAGSGWRIHGNYFYRALRNDGTTDNGVFNIYPSSSSSHKLFGLIDNNVFENIKIYATGTLQPANLSWMAPAQWGTDQAVFIENNTFIGPRPYNGSRIDSQNGARLVIRYNDFNNTRIEAHSACEATVRGGRSYEIYNNRFNGVTRLSSGWACAISMRTGSHVITRNEVSGTGYWEEGKVALDNRRSWFDGACTAGHGNADGTSAMSLAYDTFDASPAHPGTAEGLNLLPLDGIGVGTGATGHQTQDPIYIWDNVSGFVCLSGTAKYGECNTAPGIAACTDGGGTCSTNTNLPNLVYRRNDLYNSPYQIVADRDYFEETARPDWTAYTCPHPLADPSAQGSCATDAYGTTGYILTGGESDTNAPTVTSFYIYPATSLINFIEPITATSGAAFTVAGLASALTLTCPAVETAASSMTCANSRTVYQSEGNGTYGYTGTKVVDAASNALAAIESSPSAVNMSTEIENPPGYTLTISNHTGAVVTSSPSGLNCGSTCSSDFENGTVVTVGGYCLPNYTGLTIGGEHCASNGTVTVNGAKSCTAVCTKISPDVAIGSGAAVTLGSGAVGTLY